MADEEKTEQEEVEEAPAEEAAEETAPEEAPPEDAAPEAAEEAPDEADGGSDAEQDDPDGSDSAEGDQESAGRGEPEAAEEVLSPKQLRKLERSRSSGEARPQRSPEERVSERAEARGRSAANRGRYRKRTRERHRAEGAREGTPRAERPPGPKKVRLGKVVSTKSDKTITVQIEVARRHPTYEKVVRRSATLRAHDAENAAGEGDTVRIVETRPLSKTKRWRLLEIVERAR